jgi:hypothetical protein
VERDGQRDDWRVRHEVPGTYFSDEMFCQWSDPASIAVTG